MKTPKLILLLAALVILVLVGTACKKEATPTVEPTEVVVEPTEEPTAEPTEEPTAEPTEAPPPEPCSPATEGAFAGIDPRGQTVIWWHNHGSSREEGLNALLAEFNSTNDCGITVEGQNQGNYDQIRDKVNASIATGELPD
jgi:ABC-type glycerol-3-phosphate transport system substrate-binding protein